MSSKTKNIDEVASHNCGKLNGRTVVCPKKIDSETINPNNFYELKNYYNLNELLFVDRLIGTDKPVSIINHVNLSGENFLRNETPFKEFPQFPDMSKIYHKINGLEAVVVHTIGEKRFQNPPIEEKVIWSEAIGLIAPVAHYVGIKVFAIGGNNFDNVTKYMGKI